MSRPVLFALALTLALPACGGASTDTPPVAAAKPPADEDEGPKSSDDSATLDIYCSPPTKVLVDGKPAGTSPLSNFKVKPGSHDVTCVDDTGNRTMGVTVGPGDGKTVTSDRAPSIQEQRTPEKGDKGKKP